MKLLNTLIKEIKMMRVTISLLIVVLACIVPAFSADFVAYSLNYQVYGGIDPGYGVDIEGTHGSTDGYDYEGRWSSGLSSTTYNVALYKANGVDGWNGTTGFYRNDKRAPWVGQKTVIDGIYVWAGIDTFNQDMRVKQYPIQIPSDMTYKLFLMSVPNGVYYNGPREWGPGIQNITLPFYSTSDGLTGYKFRLELSPVPEPSSLLALVGGLSGMGTVMLRRRKQVR